MPLSSLNFYLHSKFTSEIISIFLCTYNCIMWTHLKYLILGNHNNVVNIHWTVALNPLVRDYFCFPSVWLSKAGERENSTWYVASSMKHLLLHLTCNVMTIQFYPISICHNYGWYEFVISDTIHTICEDPVN